MLSVAWRACWGHQSWSAIQEDRGETFLGRMGGCKEGAQISFMGKYGKFMKTWEGNHSRCQFLPINLNVPHLKHETISPLTWFVGVVMVPGPQKFGLTTFDADCTNPPLPHYAVSCH